MERCCGVHRCFVRSAQKKRPGESKITGAHFGHGGDGPWARVAVKKNVGRLCRTGQAHIFTIVVLDRALRFQRCCCRNRSTAR